MKFLRTFYSCLDRQVNKIVRIIITEAEIVLISKSELCQAPIIIVGPTTGMQEEQEGRRSHSWGRGGRGGARGLARGRSFRGRVGDRRETRLHG